MRSFHLTRLLWLSSAIIWAFLFVLGPLLSVQADVENLATETIAINPDGTLEKSDKDIALERELKAAFEAANRSLQIYSDAKERYLSLTKSLLEQGDGQNEVLRELQEMEQLKDSVMQRTKQVNSKIRDINAQQIAQLKDKISLLREREMQRRTRLNEKEHRERMSSRLKIKGIPEDAVLKQQLEELVDIESILAKSDEKLEEWFIGLVKKEVAALQEELELSVIDTTTKIGELEEDENVAALFQKEVEDCSGSTLKDAVQVVQESLVRYSQDRVGMADHLARATVVHHLTSNNYLPSIPLSQQIEFSWWFQYLPDDWERFLDKIMPTGWKQWNAKLPDFVYHTLGLTRQASTAPPEAILQTDIHPGSCWPMEGQSGQVTLRLAYPVKVKAVTLDHAPVLLLEKGQRMSAPKQLRVFGYPPCLVKKFIGTDADSKETDYLDDYLDDRANDNIELSRGICDDGLDFDVTKPELLVDFEYDIDGPTIQTFELSNEEDESEASCSETGSSCGVGDLYASEGSDAVVAVGLEILDNWGNEDYTCLYRFRVHGDAVIEEADGDNKQ